MILMLPTKGYAFSVIEEAWNKMILEYCKFGQAKAIPVCSLIFGLAVFQVLIGRLDYLTK